MSIHNYSFWYLKDIKCVHIVLYASFLSNVVASTIEKVRLCMMG